MKCLAERATCRFSVAGTAVLAMPAVAHYPKLPKSKQLFVFASSGVQDVDVWLPVRRMVWFVVRTIGAVPPHFASARRAPHLHLQHKLPP